jgi:outer membrane protein assembly factor BamB
MSRVRLPHRRRLALAAALASSLLLSACTGSSSGGANGSPSSRGSSGAPTTGATGPAVASGTSWLGYHADAARTGSVAGVAVGVPLHRAWTASLGAAVYGQPVLAGGRVVAATERNRVVALDPRTGAVQWSTVLGPPLTDVQGAAGCGNVDPLGITSTPVVDAAAGIVYVVGEVRAGGGVQHRLAGIRIADGRIVRSVVVDPPLPAGEQPITLLQRPGLVLANGRVYAAFGGNAGDCGHYHGWVVGVRTTGAAETVAFEVAPDGEGGAIWQSGGAPAVDADGDLYVSTGNANPGPPAGGPDPKRWTESVVKLSPTLHPIAAFKDPDANGDLDLSTGNPVLLPGGRVFAVGKTQTGFLLDARLRRLARIAGVCGSDPDGGPAYDRATDRLFVPCRDGGIQVIEVGKHALGPRLDGANGAPIVVGGTVWATDYEAGRLLAFDARSGRELQRLDTGALPHFASPSSGRGLVLVGTASGVVAFRA